MDLIQVVGVLILVGVLMWVFETYATMVDPTYRRLVQVVVLVVVLIWLFTLFFGPIPSVKVGR